VTRYQIASSKRKAQMRATAVEVAISGFSVNSFNRHKFIAGDLEQPEPSNSHNSFELSIDIGPALTRLTPRNISEHQVSLSPRQNKAGLVTGYAHALVMYGGRREARENK
jgi:hypothetical protein